MILAETACWDREKKIAIFLMMTFTCRSTFLYGYSEQKIIFSEQKLSIVTSFSWVYLQLVMILLLLIFGWS
jgi:hypothetical protein